MAVPGFDWGWVGTFCSYGRMTPKGYEKLNGASQRLPLFYCGCCASACAHNSRPAGLRTAIFLLLVYESIWEP